MRLSTFLASAALTAMVASPVMAQGSASKLSLVPKGDVRVGATSGTASNLQDDGGSSTGIIIAIAAAAAVGLGIYLAVDGDEESESD